MFHITESHIVRAKRTSEFKNATQLMYAVCSPNLDINSASFRGDENVAMILRQNNVLEYSELLAYEYPMAYFSAAQTGESTYALGQKLVKQNTAELETLEATRQLLLRKQQTTDDRSLSWKIEDANHAIASCTTMLNMGRNFLKIAYVDENTRKYMISKATSTDSPYWWTWVHHCQQQAMYIMAAIVRANFDDIDLYVAETRGHTLLTNSDDIVTLNSKIGIVRDHTAPCRFDMITQLLESEFSEDDDTIIRIYPYREYFSKNWIDYREPDLETFSKLKSLASSHLSYIL